MENKTSKSKPKPNNKKPKTATKKPAKNYFNEYEQIINTLSVIFLSEKTINALKSSKEFQDIITKLLTIAQQLEIVFKIKSDNNVSTSISAYENITNTKFEPTDFKINKNHDYALEITDELNYVKIFLLNSFAIKWDELVSSQKNKSTTKLEIQNDNIETVDAKKVNDSNESINNNHHNNGYINAEDFLNKNNISLEEVANNIAKQKANILLQKDIINNKFYQFDSKPKFFPILKYSLIGMWILFLIIYLLYTIFSTLMNNKFYAFKEFSTPTVSIDEFLSNVMVYNNSSGYISIAFFVLFAILVFMTIFNLLKNRKNDNVRYSLKTFVTWVLLFLFLVNFLIPLIINPDNSILQIYGKIAANVDIKPQDVTVVSQNSGKNEFTQSLNNKANFWCFQAYFVLTIMLFVIAGIFTLMTIALMIVRPKLDIERINQKVNQYYNDIISGKISVEDDSSNGGFGSLFGGMGSKNPFSPF